MAEKQFFNHLAGLRGIAIVFVVLFHLCPEIFAHGYFGVDIFLVITGYLLFCGLSRNDGSLKSTGIFAYKKLQRIIPGVSICVILTIIAGVYFLDAEVMANSARTARDTVLGLSNIQLAKALSDYFAAEATENPLLHMWYIGVTLQVYLMFAIGCMISRKIPRAYSKCLLWIIGGASLIWCYSLYIHDWLISMDIPVWKQTSEPSHYQTLPRLWEVLAGGLILGLPKLNSRLSETIASAIGLLLVLAPAISLTDSVNPCAIMVVIGTMLIIKYAQNCYLTPILTNKVVLWLGSISFSLYLIHMPLFVCSKGWIYYDLSVSHYIILFCSAILLGWIFWWTVEKRRISYKVWFPIWIAALALSITCKNTRGFFRYVHAEANMNLLPAYPNWSFCTNQKFAIGFDKELLTLNDGVFILLGESHRHFKPESGLPILNLGDTEAHEPNFVLFGDSHAQSLVAGFDSFCRNNNCSGIYLSSIITPFWNVETTPQGGDPTYYCNRAKMQALKNWLKSQPEIKYVVVSQFWFRRLYTPSVLNWDLKPIANPSVKFYEESLKDFCIQMKECRKEVVFIGQIPHFKKTPARFVRWSVRRGKQKQADYSIISQTLEQYNEQYAHIISLFNHLKEKGLCHVISPQDAISPAQPFCAYTDNTLLMQDDNHLSAAGSIWLIEQLDKLILHTIQHQENHQ